MGQRKSRRPSARRKAIIIPSGNRTGRWSVIDYLGSGVILRPVQFDEIWRQIYPHQQSKRLALAVVQQAAEDLRAYHPARLRADQRLYREAHKWVASDERAWPYSFVNLCDALQLSPTALRAQLLDQHQSAAA
jgi:hypothetical protein